MAENDQTSVEEPVTSLTSDPEPESISDDDASKTAQPTVEELQAKLAEIQSKNARLENNYKGTFSEWNREKQERERLQNLINQRFESKEEVRKDPEFPSDDELAKREHEAILNGDVASLAAIRKIEREKSKNEAAREVSEMIQGVTTQQNQQSSLVRFFFSGKWD